MAEVILAAKPPPFKVLVDLKPPLYTLCEELNLGPVYTLTFEFYL